MMDRINDLACRTCLKNMLDKGWLSICDIDKIGDMMGVHYKSSPAYRTLSLLHCIDFSKMPSELRCEIPKLIRECLGVNPFENTQSTMLQIDEPKRRWFGLIG